jgi:UPF0755 protein
VWLVVLVAVVAVGLAGCSSGGERVLDTYLRANLDEVHLPASVDSRPVRFVIEPGTPARAIGARLLEEGLITDDVLFEAYVRVNGLAAELEAGTFLLAPSMTLVEIVETLRDARADSVVVTIPEGWRLEQIGEYLAEEDVFGDGGANAAAYVAQVASGDLTGLDVSRYPFLQERPAGASLEGYLFPDTYELPAAGGAPLDLLTRQLDTFAARVIPLYDQAVVSGTTDMDLFTVLTLASIVEREAVVPEERPAIAAVYLNRLANGIPLEADPTVQYAMGYQETSDQWWKTPVFLEEYSSVVSPYNTYLNGGLPPGPIASPGLSSIQAVLAPEDHDYLYFVATPDGTGRHIFAATFDEHTANVLRYQSGQ